MFQLANLPDSLSTLFSAFSVVLSVSIGEFARQPVNIKQLPLWQRLVSIGEFARQPVNYETVPNTPALG